MAPDNISGRTKIPLGWILGGLLGTAPIFIAVLFYFSDLRTQTIVNSTSHNALQLRVQILERDVKNDIREIKQDIKKLLEQMKGTK